MILGAGTWGPTPSLFFQNPGCITTSLLPWTDFVSRACFPPCTSSFSTCSSLGDGRNECSGRPYPTQTPCSVSLRVLPAPVNGVRGTHLTGREQRPCLTWKATRALPAGRFPAQQPPAMPRHPGRRRVRGCEHSACGRLRLLRNGPRRGGSGVAPAPPDSPRQCAFYRGVSVTCRT